MHSILIYSGTYNLGDAIQTYAMARLLPQPLLGIYRHEAHQSAENNNVFVVNGWLGDKVPNTANNLFAGVHLGRNRDMQIAWIKNSRFQCIGSRDPFTSDLLRKHGVTTAIDTIGCATMTLPRYAGPRQGILNVDLKEKHLDSNAIVSNRIPSTMTWSEQWNLAEQRIDQLRKAELVYTCRLHIALPCIAMGTPVFIPKSVLQFIQQPERLSCLDILGFRYDEPFVADISKFAKLYIEFLSKNLGIPLAPCTLPSIPLPREQHESLAQ